MKTMKVTRSDTTYHEETVPTTLEGFKNWEFTSGGYTGKDFKRFARLFKNHIKKSLSSGFELVNPSKNNHYYLCGFITNGTKYVYFSISDVRYFPNKWINDIMYRTAQHEKDYTGGSNRYTTLENFARDVEALLE